MKLGKNIKIDLLELMIIVSGIIAIVSMIL